MTKIESINLIKLLPYFLQESKDIKLITQVVQEELDLINEKEDRLFVYGKFDMLDEPVLDELAYHWKAEGYEQTHPHSVKAKLVETAYVVMKTKGTRMALEKVVSNIYGEANVKEWFEYKGDPHHFTIDVGDLTIDREKIKELHKRVEKGKRESSELDAISYSYESSNTLVRNLGSSKVIRNISLLDNEIANSLVVGGEYGSISKAIEVENEKTFIPYVPTCLYKIVDANLKTSIYEVDREGSKVRRYRGRVVLKDILIPATLEFI